LLVVGATKQKANRKRAVLASGADHAMAG